MSDNSQPTANLSSEKRSLLELQMQKVATEAVKRDTISSRLQQSLVPLSFAQQRLWFLQQLEPDNAVYNITQAFHLQGCLNNEVLQQAINEIICRHESLRTTFKVIDGQPVQEIAEYLEIEIPLVDIQLQPPAEQMKEVQRLLKIEVLRPFDLERGPLLRAALISLEPHKCILFLSMHHTITDGWSWGIFFHELSSLYTSNSLEKPSTLSELSIQYADFSEWQHRKLQGHVLEQQLAYWKKQLIDPPVLSLPTDRLRKPVQTYRGEKLPFVLNETVTQNVISLSRNERVTVFMTLFAVFNILLFRYSTQEDILVGSPIANRTHTELEGLIGFFVNTLVLRTDLSGNPSFKDLLRRVRDGAFDAYSHQDLPFEKIVEKLFLRRDLSRNPLFQVMFVFQNTSAGELKLDGIDISTIEVNTGLAKFDLTVELCQHDENIKGYFEYNADLFNQETIERMILNFQFILKSIVGDPDRRLSELPLMAIPERQKLLVGWNDTETDYPRNKCVHHLFEKQVERTPNATALICEGIQISYGELNRRSNQLAHYLIDIGVAPNVLVGIFVDRSIEMMVGLLGIMKAGGAYVPLDPAYPKERLSYMLEETKSPVLITQSKFKSDLPASSAQVIIIDSELSRKLPDAYENSVLHSGKQDPENLAYVIFTSGSTGRPKGVQVPHRAVSNFLTSMCRKPGVGVDDTILAVTTLSFDIHVLELFTPLIVGGKVIIASRESVVDGGQLVDILSDSYITMMQATPSTWRQMIDAGWKGSKQLKALCGGEPFPKDLVAELIDRVGTLWNMYGPTETTVWSTMYQVKDAEEPVLIGRPIANTRIYVLNAVLQPVPIGVQGELYIGGDGVTNGYLNRSDLTSKAFVLDPFSVNPNTFIYKTGDLVKYHSDGNVEYLNRLDNQVKIRGFRIELGEIEAVIGTHPSVKQVVVVVKELASDDQRLIAYYEQKEDTLFDIGELRSHLRKTLPNYMIPQHFSELKKFPLTPAGKINRKALTSLEWIGLGQERSYEPPRDILEVQLTRAWEDTLKHKPIGILDDFFELGGHSLLAVRLFAQIEQLIGIRLPLATLFEATTIEQLARFIRDHKWQAPWSPLVEIQSKGTKKPLFLIHGAGGNVLFYRDLAFHLGVDQPVYGLQSRGLDGQQPFHTRVEEMASDYSKAIKRIQPEGPYLLGGYCLGGTIALEIAHQLRSGGDEVALLALFETYNLANTKEHSMFAKVYFYIQKMLFHWQNLHILRKKQKLIFLKEKLNVVKERQQVWMGMFLANLRDKSRGSTPKAQQLYELWQNNDRVANNYIPKIYPGRITHFRPIKEYRTFDNPGACWEKIATDGVKTYRLPVYPAGMLLEPFVRNLAEKLQEALQGN